MPRPPGSLWLCVALCAPLWSCSKGCGQTIERQSQRLDAFVTAWAEQRFDDAWQLMDSHYRRTVPSGLFRAEMADHPFLRGVTGGSFTHDWSDRHEGHLYTADGDLRTEIEMYSGPDEWFVDNVKTAVGGREYCALPQRWEGGQRNQNFLRALVNRRWAEAYEHTHPHYRSQVDEDLFASALGKNLWLVGATGFRIAAGEHPDQLVLAKGAVPVEVTFGEYDDRSWISEVIIGGTPTLPKPDRVEVQLEKE